MSHNSTEMAAEYCVCAQNSTLFNVHFMLTSKTPAANTSPSGTLPSTPPQNQTLCCKGLQNTPPSGTQGLTGIDVFKHASPVSSVFFTLLPSPVLLTTPSRKWTALTVICQRRAQSKLAHSPAPRPGASLTTSSIAYYSHGLKFKPRQPGRTKSFPLCLALRNILFPGYFTWSSRT